MSCLHALLEHHPRFFDEFAEVVASKLFEAFAADPCAAGAAWTAAQTAVLQLSTLQTGRGCDGWMVRSAT